MSPAMSFAMSLADAFHNKTCFSLILQTRPDEFCYEFQTHRGQGAQVSREWPEPDDGELLV